LYYIQCRRIFEAVAMTLTVRLDANLQAALDRYCAERGVTKTLAVQECLAQYLVQASAGAAAKPAAAGIATASANHRAFADAGLIGAVVGGGLPADKAAVRARVRQRLAKGPDAA